jgi:hypothetical protein
VAHQTIGDAFMEFASALDASNCAIETSNTQSAITMCQASEIEVRIVVFTSATLFTAITMFTAEGQISHRVFNRLPPRRDCVPMTSSGKFATPLTRGSEKLSVELKNVQILMDLSASCLPCGKKAPASMHRGRAATLPLARAPQLFPLF